MANQAQQDKSLKIRAENIGPIMHLDGVLSSKSQNLIFAQNGTGKSFLARSLRLLGEDYLDYENPEKMANDLVSEEAKSKQGSFSLYEGDNCIGGIEIDLNNSNVTPHHVEETHTKIFHVFSGDYVKHHLEQRDYYIDEEIGQGIEIIVGHDSIVIDNKEREINTLSKELAKCEENLHSIFSRMRADLKNEFSLRNNLESFKLLVPNRIYENVGFDKRLENLSDDYKNLTSLPDPENIIIPLGPSPSNSPLDFEEIKNRLMKVTLLSNIEHEIKSAIEEHRDFFRTGVDLIDDENNICPFCTQSLSSVTELINIYKQYFDAAESKEVSELEKIKLDVITAQASVESWRVKHLEANSRYDELRPLFSLVKEINTEDPTILFSEINEFLSILLDCLSKKIENLSSPIEISTDDVEEKYQEIVLICGRNNSLFERLGKLVNRSDQERKRIRNDACHAFLNEFSIQYSHEIHKIIGLNKKISDLEKEVAELREDLAKKESARQKFIETFRTLLGILFAEKYTFCDTTFKVLRNKSEMNRGPGKTLSDGEKSVLAFCFFIAQIHLKIKTNDDYSNIFLVFDDPVTSMSFDFIHKIVQALRMLRISKEKGIKFGLKLKTERPKMLVLTHNHHFCNIAEQNGLLKSNNCFFQLAPRGKNHELFSLRKFVNAHQLHLQHVYDVSKEIVLPNHTTGNSIRSVLEGINRFCRPDIKDLSDFLEIVKETVDGGNEMTNLYSLINDLSHGGKFDDFQIPNQIISAAQGAIIVVDHFAEGQTKDIPISQLNSDSDKMT